MNRKTDLTALLHIGAALTWIAAVAVLVQAGMRHLQAPERIRARLADLSALSDQESVIHSALSAREAFLSSHPATAKELPLDWKALTDRSMEGATTNSVRETGRQPLIRGTAVRMRVEAEQAPLAALSPLIETAEAADPPWRLVALSIEPDSPKPGKGKVALEFERISNSLKPD